MTTRDRARLLIDCPDGPGIVAAVSGFLAEHGANIVESAQHSTDPEGGHFFMRMEFDLAGLDERLRRRCALAFEPRSRERVRRWTGAWTTRDEPQARGDPRLARRPLPARAAVALAQRGELAGRGRRSSISNHPDLARGRRGASGIAYHHVPVDARRPSRRPRQRLLELLARRRRPRRARALHADPVGRLPRRRSACRSSTSTTRSCPRSPAPTPTSARTSAG